MGTVKRDLWSDYWGQVIAAIKSCQPEVKASQSDKWLQSYGHLKGHMGRGHRSHLAKIK